MKFLAVTFVFISLIIGSQQALSQDLTKGSRTEEVQKKPFQALKIWWVKWNQGQQAKKANVYGHRGYKFSPNRVNKNIMTALAEFAPNRQPERFNPSVVENLHRFSSSNGFIARSARTRQERRRSNR